jgi:hypothetical protein
MGGIGESAESRRLAHNHTMQRAMPMAFQLPSSVVAALRQTIKGQPTGSRRIAAECSRGVRWKDRRGPRAITVPASQPTVDCGTPNVIPIGAVPARNCLRTVGWDDSTGLPAVSSVEAGPAGKGWGCADAWRRVDGAVSYPAFYWSRLAKHAPCYK